MMCVHNVYITETVLKNIPNYIYNKLYTCIYKNYVAVVPFLVSSSNSKNLRFLKDKLNIPQAKVIRTLVF